MKGGDADWRAKEDTLLCCASNGKEGKEKKPENGRKSRKKRKRKIQNQVRTSNQDNRIEECRSLECGYLRAAKIRCTR